MSPAETIPQFLDGNGRLIALPVKRKKKLAALYYLASKIPAGNTMTEGEFNDLLDLWHTFHDPATLRRELYNNRFINRASDGSAYWLEPQQPVWMS